MNKYNIEIKETLSHVCQVEANSLREAILKIKHKYHNGDIILNEDNLVATEFNDMNEHTSQKKIKIEKDNFLFIIERIIIYGKTCIITTEKY